MFVLDDPTDVRAASQGTCLCIDLNVVGVLGYIIYQSGATVNPGIVNGGWALREKRMGIFG